jgi:hypothetical protein
MAPAPTPKPAPKPAPKPPAPAPRPAAAQPARPAPQADLFEPAGGGAATTTVAAPAARAEASAGPLDKPALRSLLAELQALRAVMIKDPSR